MFWAVEEAGEAVREHVGVLVGVLCRELGEELESGFDVKKAKPYSLVHKNL